MLWEGRETSPACSRGFIKWPKASGPRGMEDRYAELRDDRDRCAEFSMPTGREVTESGKDPEKGMGEALIVLSSLYRKPRSTFHCFILSSMFS